MMNKTAYEYGMEDAFASLGLEKTAIWGPLARAGAGIAKGLGAAGKAIGSGGRQLSRSALVKGQGTGMMGKMRSFGGQQLQNVGRSLGQAGTAFAANPLGTMGRGLANFGQGALMLQGKGIGGALGKGVGAYGYGSALLGGGGGSPAPQQPQMMNNMYGGY